MPLPHRGPDHSRTVGYLSPSLALIVLLLFLSLATAGCAPERTPRGDLEPTVILVSIDGFRWDYLSRYDTPSLDRLAERGVHASKLLPVFPTETFPNHYSAVTGLYPENHGILSNTMYDPEWDAEFSLSNRDAVSDGRWWEGEPIWVTAEKQGQTAATYFWPGSEAAIGGVRPTYWYEFDANVSGDDRVDQVLEWLESPADQRPTFITLYFSELDVAGHDHGPNSPEVADAVESVDEYVGNLLDGLQERSMLDRVDVVVISDHGMAETSPDRVIVLDRYVDPSAARIVRWNPTLMMYPEEHAENETYEALQSDPHLSVYWKEDLPERYHLDHPRTPPLIAVAETGWTISTKDRLTNRPESFHGGSHGYDNRAGEMAGLFIASGPSFRQGMQIETVDIVQLYDLMCGILGLEPAPNDGRAGALNHLLVPQTSIQHVED